MPLIGRKKLSKAIAVDLYAQTNKAVKGVFLSGLTLIVKGTPVDTGRARNNWFLTVGAPSSKTTEGGGQLPKLPENVLNNKLYFTNNLPYVVGLENGTSKQAPTGWVKKAIMLMEQKIRGL